MTRHTAFLREMALAVQLCIACQGLSAQGEPKRPVALTRADANALSAAGPNQRIDWNWLNGALDATPREDRQGLLKQLIASPREDLACGARGIWDFAGRSGPGGDR